MSITGKIWGSILLNEESTTLMSVSSESAVAPELHLCNTSKSHVRVWVSLNGNRFATWELWPEGSSRLQLPSLPSGATVTARASIGGAVRCVASGGSQT